MQLYLWIYHQVAVYSVNEKANLHIDLKNLILNIWLFVLISYCLVFILINRRKNLIGKSYKNSINKRNNWFYS